jgi:hypothetical protein
MILRWGNRRGESASLPCPQLATVEASGWAAANVVEVVIPASLALDAGIWSPVASGIRGLVVAVEARNRLAGDESEMLDARLASLAVWPVGHHK